MRQKYIALVFLMIGLTFLSGCAEDDGVYEPDEDMNEVNEIEENDYETDESIEEPTPDQGDMIEVPPEEVDMIVEETLNQAIIDDSDDVEIGDMI